MVPRVRRAADRARLVRAGGVGGSTDDGRCLACGWQVPGRFDGPPGTWGRRRVPVRLPGGRGRGDVVRAASGRAGCASPAVAGRFYPDDPAQLRATPCAGHVADRRRRRRPATAAKAALIAPHAGYRYSGPTAGAAYRASLARRGGAARAWWCCSARPPGAGRRPGRGRQHGGRVAHAARRRAARRRRRAEPWSTRALAVVGRRRPRPRAQPRGPPAVPARGPRPGAGRAAGRRAVPGRRRRPTRWAGCGAATRPGGGVVRPEPLPATTTRPGPATTAPAGAILEGRVDDIGPDDACGLRGRRAGCCWRPATHGVAPSLAGRGHVGRRGRRRRAGWSGYASFGLRRPAAAHRRRAGVAAGPGPRRDRSTRCTTGEPDPLDDDDVPERGSCCSGASFVTLDGERRAGRLHRVARGASGRCGATSSATPAPRRSTTRASPRWRRTTWPAR